MPYLRELHNVADKVSELQVGKAVVAEVLQEPAATGCALLHVGGTAKATWREQGVGAPPRPAGTGGGRSTAVLDFPAWPWIQASIKSVRLVPYKILIHAIIAIV